MLSEDVLSGLVLASYANHGEERIERDLLERLDWGIWITLIHQLVEVEKVDEHPSELVCLESDLRYRVPARQLADEEARLAGDRQRLLLNEQFGAYLINLDILEDPVLGKLLAIGGLREDVEAGHDALLSEQLIRIKHVHRPRQIYEQWREQVDLQDELLGRLEILYNIGDSHYQLVKHFKLDSELIALQVMCARIELFKNDRKLHGDLVESAAFSDVLGQRLTS